jgi:hypothetical protein
LKAGFAKYNNQYSTGFTNNFNPMSAVSQNLTWNLPPGATAPGGPCAPVVFEGLPAPNPRCFPTGGFSGSGALAGVGAGTLGPSTNPSFGSVAAGTGVNLDPNWHRDYVFAYNAGIQQELAKGVTLNFNWYRGARYQQTLVTNRAVPFSAWTPLTITNPLDGSPIAFYNLNLAALPGGRIPNPDVLQTNAPQSLVRNVYTAYETSVVARLRRGMFATFGWTVERAVDRSCAMSAGTPASITGNKLNDPNWLRFCDMFGDLYQDLGKIPNLPWENEFKAQGAIPLRWGLVASASFYSNRYQYAYTSSPTPGAVGQLDVRTGGVINNGYLARTWNLTANTVYPAHCVGCTPGARIFPAGFVMGQSSENINLMAPGQVLTPRLNQLDLSLKKTIRLGERFVLEPEAQVFNVLNTNAAVAEGVAIPSATSLTASNDVSAFLPKSACTGSSLPNCGLGGNVNTITNPRLLRLALLFRF